MTAIRLRPRSASPARRAGGAEGPWHHILLACDGGTGTLSAGRRALELAVRDGATLTVVLVRPIDDRAIEVAEEASDAIRRILAAAARAGVAAHSEVRRGQAGAAILEAAREVEADLIVIGRQGPCIGTSFAVANCGYVVTHSDRPVLVVQPWARDADLLDESNTLSAREVS